MELVDEEGQVLVSWTPDKAYDAVIISTPQIKEGSSYILKTGEVQTEIVMDGLSYTEGVREQPMGEPGQKAQEIFKRYEKKYLLSADQYRVLLQRLDGYMTKDEYGKHTISNIYFDTGNFELIRHSIEKPVYKEKLRLRAYGQVTEKSRVFVELKKKYDGIVYKRRAELSMGEARSYLYQGHYPKQDSQILREIDYTCRFYGLEPKMFVAYDRIALSGNEDKELRVTFDEKIRYRNQQLDLTKGSGGTSLLPSGMVLMEIKIPGAMPVWMSRMLSELGICPTSYSKYGASYKLEFYKQKLYEKGEQIYAS